MHPEVGGLEGEACHCSHSKWQGEYITQPDERRAKEGRHPLESLSVARTVSFMFSGGKGVI